MSRWRLRWPTIVLTDAPGPKPALWRRLLWMTLIWLLSVSVLLGIAAVLRLVLRT